MSINRGNVVLVIGMLAAGTANTIITKCTLFVLVALPSPLSAPAVLFLFSLQNSSLSISIRLHVSADNDTSYLGLACVSNLIVE